MHDEHPHPLLAQVPLTVSPFVSLPTATPLPYAYKTLPSTLPPSVTDVPATAPAADVSADANAAPPKPAYVTSSSGHAAHPDHIIASCRALQAHLTRLTEDAQATVRKWEDQIRERDLAEKRRVAPGWLDEEVKLLVPERKGGAEQQGLPGQQQQRSLLDADEGGAGPMTGVVENNKEGEELDRAFGGMGIR
ncbi:uncharacterized protein K452DRAFT_289091 [Aplosporella prunicola CBS 121167]|uniref:Uncharacterized protein n=1 Tax=Aplosporella prunicola CBS 121167 TaxID=1176127 RepID=A0A6A6BCX6_9PEZI|nr:uncharacterized protein K452DRAFT_289091 [Aplosporella prunicola CBS 121167]KAF2140351.1 hypothetical protein K452DRAFT_289091 [Aplosporella prunicola CBS 121167]